MSRTSQQHFGADTGSGTGVRSANSISYPVKPTNATLGSDLHGDAAVGFPVSTTIEPLVEPSAAGYPMNRTTLVLGDSEATPPRTADALPGRPTTKTLNSPAFQRAVARQSARLAASAGRTAKSAATSARGRRNARVLATLASNVLLAFMVAGLLGGLVPGLHQLTSQERGAALNEYAVRLSDSQAVPGNAPRANDTTGEVLRSTVSSEPVVNVMPPQALAPLPASESLEVVAGTAELHVGRAVEAGAENQNSGARSLLQEGHRRMQSGDIAGARALFERAAEQGLAQAALALGSTYDARSLDATGVRYVVPDSAAAISWYRRAHQLASEAPR